MSHFTCPHCGTDCIDSPRGYEHYPADVPNRGMSALDAMARYFEQRERFEAELQAARDMADAVALLLLAAAEIEAERLEGE